MTDHVRKAPRLALTPWLAALAVAALVASGCGEPKPGTLRDRWELSNGALRIRGEVYDEGNLSHRLAVFDERRCHLLLRAAVGNEPWRDVVRAYFAPCDKDVRSHVRFVNQSVAYVFLQWWYMVTADGGRTWATWDVAAKLPTLAYASPSLIDDVVLAPDGTGTMTLNPVGTVSHERVRLRTTDFGRAWVAP
jgi:hypothetical protein